MANRTIYYLARINYPICPVCKSRIFGKKATKLYIGIEVTVELPFCNKCREFFINNDTIKKIRDQYGRFPCILNIDSARHLNLEKLRKKMYTPIINDSKSPEFRNNKLIGVNKRIRIVNGLTNYCPACNYLLSFGYVKISDSNHQNGGSLIIDGGYCHYCNELLSVQSKYIYSNLSSIQESGYSVFDKTGQLPVIIKKHSDRKVVKLSPREKYICDNIRSWKASVNNIVSAVLSIVIEYTDDNSREVYVIVTSEEYSDTPNHIYHYKSNLALELLTAVYYEKREKKGQINEREYIVIQTPAPTIHSGRFRINPQRLIMDKALNIKPDGGFLSSLRKDNCEIVDVLIYSELTGKYEIIKATYSFTEKLAFVDILMYRRFVEQYGNPGIRLLFPSESSNWNDFIDLKSESVLRCCGYNVSQKDNLSDQYRQSLLRDIIDLEILSQKQVIQYLEFFISSHSSEQYYYAVSKWTLDRDFVLNYIANPSRFLISPSIK